MLGKNNSALWHKGKLVTKRWSPYIGRLYSVHLLAEAHDA